MEAKEMSMRDWTIATTFALLISVFSGAAYAGGDPAAGKAQAMVCAACHGADGATGIDPSYPSLAGQNEKYLNRQLTMFQSGARNIPVMTAQLIGKSEKDLADLAAFYASLPAKGKEAGGSDVEIATATRIYKGGIAAKGVAACAACHGVSGEGNMLAGFPRIGGQMANYTIAQLTAYREGQRDSDEEYGAMMRNVAQGLTDGEIRLLADYLQGLGR
tara:strand:- start:15601 stop:16251 length:651 start_codon:yes stop_codon:yes gene_type:complete